MTNRARNLIVSLVLLALAIGYLAWSYAYPPQSREVPVLVAWLTMGLCLLDVIAHTGTAFGDRVAGIFSGRAHIEAADDLRFTREECLSMLWMAISLVTILVAGLLPAALIYVFGYMTIHGRLSLRLSAAVAIGTTLFCWVVFDVLLNFELYGGLFFND